MRFNHKDGVVEMTAEEQKLILSKLDEIPVYDKAFFPTKEEIDKYLIPNLNEIDIVYFAFYLKHKYSILKLQNYEQRNGYKRVCEVIENKIKILSIDEYFCLETKQSDP